MDSRFDQKPLWLYAVKGAASAGLILLVKLLLMLFTFLYYTANTSFRDDDMYLVYIVIFVASLVIYNSVIGLFQSFDPPSAAEYLSGAASHKTKFGKLYAYPSFLMEYGTATLILSVTAALGLFPELLGMFYTKGGASPYSSGVLPFFLCILIFTLCYLWRRSEAVLYWRELDKKGRLFELGGNRTVAFRFLLILLFYPTVLPGFPLVFMIPSTLIAVFFATSEKLTLFGAILATLGLILAIILIKTLLALKRRRKFLKRLHESARVSGYEISEIQNPYRSLFSRAIPCRFDLSFRGITYNCLILGCRHKSVPICFSSESEGYFRYRLGTKNHHITLNFTFTYQINGDGIKILILEPTPKRALICEEDREKVLFNADRLWENVVYEADAFLGTMERYCLGKADAYRG